MIISNQIFINMKLHYQLYTLIICLFFSCKEEFIPMLDSPDKRTVDTLAKYQNILAEENTYWKLSLKTGTGELYNFIIKFDDNKRVKMLADINEKSAMEFAESSYHLEALLRPTLNFDTYNYLHVINDPNPDINGGASGVGSKADFSFSLLGYQNDSISLYGNFNKNTAHLVKMESSTAQQILNGAWLETMGNFKTFYTNSNFPYIQADDTQLLLTVDTNLRLITFIPFENQTAGITQNLHYAYDIDMIEFSSPLNFRNKTYNGLLFDRDVQEFYLLDGGNKLYLQNQSTFPVNVNTFLGYGMNYTYIQINNYRLPYNISSDFNNVWQKAVTALKTNDNRVINYASFRFLSETEFQVIVNYSTPNFFGDPTSQNNFSGDCVFNITYNGNQFTLDEGEMSGNWEGRQNSLKPLRDYFANSTFIKKWVTSTEPDYSKTIMGAYQKINAVNDFVYGIAK